MKVIPNNSKATFTFPSDFQNRYSAEEWFYDEIQSVLGTKFDLDVVESFEQAPIIIQRKSCDHYYDIVFTTLYDIDGNTPLRFQAISQDHFANIIPPKTKSNLEDEKAGVLETIFNEMTDKYVEDENILTSNLLDLIINKCNQLKKSDF